jgi:hypothetical protein
VSLSLKRKILCAVLLLVTLQGWSQMTSSNSVPDAVATVPMREDDPAKNNDSLSWKKKIRQSLPDANGQNASFENGRWQLPDAPSLRNPGKGKNAMVGPDSLKEAVPLKRLYSDRSLQQLYDSLGISKMDTMLALAGVRKNMSQDELLDAVNGSFPELTTAKDPGKTLPANADLSQMNLPKDITSQLPPMRGFTLPSTTDLVLDSLGNVVRSKAQRDALKALYRKSLDSLNAAEDGVTETKSARFKSKVDSLSTMSIDSLKKAKAAFNSTETGSSSTPKLDSLLASVAGNKEKIDSLRGKDMSATHRQLTNRYRVLLDSLDRLDRKILTKHKTILTDSLGQFGEAKNKISQKQKNMTDKVGVIVLQEKPTFWQHLNFEGVLGVLENTNSKTIVQFSPAVDYSIGTHLSLGGGPNMLLTKTKTGVSLAGGYRVLSKYYVFQQHAYFQVEDTIDPQRIRAENGGRREHSVLAGAGYLMRVSSSLAVNAQLLYRVNNPSYADGAVSPWVFRIGLSSIRAIHKK